MEDGDGQATANGYAELTLSPTWYSFPLLPAESESCVVLFHLSINGTTLADISRNRVTINIISHQEELPSQEKRAHTPLLRPELPT